MRLDDLPRTASAASDVHARLVEIAEREPPTTALHSVARAIAEAVAADACTIFVQSRSNKNGVVPRTHFGPPSEPAMLALETSVATTALYDLRTATGAIGSAMVLGVPVAAINQAIGTIVMRRAANAPFTAQEIMRVSGAAAQIVDLVESALLSERIERAEIEDHRSRTEPPPPVGERTFQGIAASPGIAIGAATFRTAFPPALVRRNEVHRGTVVENERFRDALERTRSDLLRMQSAAASELGEEEALIFGAHLLLLNDPMLRTLVDQGIIVRELSAAVAVEEAFDEVSRRLSQVRDPYIQGRVEDLADLRSRILDHLVGRPGQEDVGTRVVIGTRTTPSLVLELKAHGALGIASELGGVTSHGVLLARALGVPAVTGIEGLTHHVQVGDQIIVDGTDGRVVVRPTKKTRAEYERRSRALERRRTESAAHRGRPAMTAEGTRILLLANIALGADLVIARENGADGIGLYRTEFPFIVRDALPTIEEQTRIYARAYEAFPKSPVTFRLLDLAGDKFVAGRDFAVAKNAFHGYRSIRILFDHPYVLRDQVQAFAMAARGRELSILIPMITCLEDVRRIKHLVIAALAELPATHPRGLLAFGAMVETPAASEIVSELAREVDFFSIGTNDLVQYMLVADREDPRMAAAGNACHPAILRVLRRVVVQAHAAGKRVTVCGEIAARPELAIALLAIGVDALSVMPRAIPELKQVLAQVFVEPLRGSLDELLALSVAEDVERVLRGYERDYGSPEIAARPKRPSTSTSPRRVLGLRRARGR